jgi:hypothetical protein
MPRIYPNENLGRTVARNISRPIHQSLANNLGFAGNLGDMLLGFIQQHADPENNLGREGRFPLPNSKDFEKLFGATTGKMLPQDFISGPRNASERVLDFVGSNVPSMAKGTFTGLPAMLKRDFSGLGPLLKGLGKPTASGSVMEAIQGAGGGAGLEMGAGITSDVLFDLLTNRNLGTGAIRKYGEEQQEKYASSARSRVKGKVEKASNLRDKLETAHDAMSKISVEETKKVKPELEKLLNDLSHGKLSLEDAWDKKSSYQRLAYDKVNLTPYERSQYKHFAGLMEDFIQEKGAKHPGFIHDYETTKDLTKGVKYKSPLQKVLERSYDPESNSGSKLKRFISPILLATGSAALGHPKLGLGAVGTGLALYKGTQYYDMLKKSKVLQSYVSGLAKAQVSGSLKQTEKLLFKINDHLKTNAKSLMPNGELD